MAKDITTETCARLRAALTEARHKAGEAATSISHIETLENHITGLIADLQQSDAPARVALADALAAANAALARQALEVLDQIAAPGIEVEDPGAD